MSTSSGVARKTQRNWLNPSTWHLRTRLVLVAMALLVAICGAVGVVSYASMDMYFNKQLDKQLEQASGRANDFGRAAVELSLQRSAGSAGGPWPRRRDT
ncbi:hypothetical protein StoSoilB13_48370 (plasmid) [Arthrobacter sp. StoSoilB13]|nr:hypothetical protein StoSoilB13_48370 [Arthrobacter sp. StoSoilB13]